MIETDTIETDTIETDMIAGMTGVIIETTDAMTEGATMDGIADEVTIVMIITEAMIGIATHATTTDRASSHLQSDIFNCWGYEEYGSTGRLVHVFRLIRILHSLTQCKRN
jgi:hypothetical protein